MYGQGYMAMICPSCGNVNADDALICELCQTIFRRVPTSQTSVATPPPHAVKGPPQAASSTRLESVEAGRPEPMKPDFLALARELGPRMHEASITGNFSLVTSFGEVPTIATRSTRAGGRR
jgi:hypothetical protein